MKRNMLNGIFILVAVVISFILLLKVLSYNMSSKIDTSNKRFEGYIDTEIEDIEAGESEVVAKKETDSNESSEDNVNNEIRTDTQETVRSKFDMNTLSELDKIGVYGLVTYYTEKDSCSIDDTVITDVTIHENRIIINYENKNGKHSITRTYPELNPLN